MKISREQLKALVKECVVEVLREGLDRSPVVSATPTRTTPTRRNRDVEPLPGFVNRSTSPLDESVNGSFRRPLDPLLDVPVRAREQSYSSIAPSPVMAAIFADTANSTLLEQDAGRGAVAGDAATRAMASVDPEQLFSSEQVDSWSRAAFAPVRPGLERHVPDELKK